MTVLFGHPTGNPNSHQAALAHFDAGRLEAFCVPWFPSAFALAALQVVPATRAQAARLSRRRFAPLASAPMVQGRLGEFRRLLLRAAGRGGEKLSYEANDWLMQTMTRECDRAPVNVVHAYEDCALWQFERAKRLGKVCLYDMPIGYYPAWQALAQELRAKYQDWLGDETEAGFARPAQKAQEMALADCVLAPSAFVAETIQTHWPDKHVEIAPYGVDASQWTPRRENYGDGGDTGRRLRFLFVGQCSIRKGVPVLLEAWRLAALKDASLDLVGAWRLSDAKRRDLPANVSWRGAMDRDSLRRCYQEADVFVFPTFFEGRALVVGEAMSCGLPVITTRQSGADSLINPSCARIVSAGDVDDLAEALRWFAANRESLGELSRAARRSAEAATWANYRAAVDRACGAFV